MLVVDGVLIIDKPAGITSHDVVASARRILRERRIGHTGTLDPFATGVLVLLIGRATRLAQFLSGAEKEYEAIVRLGIATDTGDITGKPILDASPSAKLKQSWLEGEIETSLQKLRGEIVQIPPMYSAKKLKGQKLYELARRGEKVERQPVRVHVHAFELLAPAGSDRPLLKENDEGTVDLAVRVVCSAGTYVRTLAEDLGMELGTRAHLATLRRTRAGEFPATAAITLDRLQEIVAEGSLGTILIPPELVLRKLPFVHLNSSEAQRARHGMAIRMVSEIAQGWSPDQEITMRDDEGRLIAVGYYDAASKLLQPRVVIDAEK
jgi:tRNA pseudouridine55 synthase